MMARHCRALQLASWCGVTQGKSSPLLCKFSSLCGGIESSELPDWFKAYRGEETSVVNSDDEFVLPTSLESLIAADNSRVSSVPGTDVSIKAFETVDSDVDEVGTTLKNTFSSPEAVVLSLDGCSVKVSKSLVDKILRKFSNDWVPAFGFFKWADTQVGYGYKHSSETYDMMVDILGKCKQFKLMWELVEGMAQIGGLVSLATMTRVIRRLAGAGRWGDAIKTFHDLEFFEVKKDTLAMNVLLDSLCKEKSVKHARDAFMELRRQIPPNASSFNILVHGWCKVQKLEEARQTLEEMRVFGFTPCVISYTSLIEAYCAERNFGKVNAILDEMRSEGCLPNVVTHTIIMHALGKAKEPKKAFQVLEKMKSDGCTRDTSFYNSLIHILSRAGRLGDAKQIFEEMFSNGISPDVTTYNTMISAYCDHSQEENAFKLLQKLGDTSCKPDIKSYSPLLKLCCKRKWTKILMYLLKDMFRKDVSLDSSAYTLLIQGLCQNGKLSLSCMFFSEMVRKGLNPKPHTYDLLMEALEKNKMYVVKGKIQQLMIHAQGMKQQNYHSMVSGQVE